MRHGFTLVELLVATALAVMLAAGSLRVVASIRAQVEAQRDHSLTDGAAADQVVDLIRDDLTHAASCSQVGGKIEMVGYGSLDRSHFDHRPGKKNQNASHQPVKIEYFIQRLGDVNWLVRRQTDLNVLSNRNAWTELARAHVQSIEVRPLGLSSAAQGQVTTLRTKDKAPPDHLRLVITADEAKTTTIDTVIYLR